MSPNLALLLVHDLLVAKRGISAASSHPLRVTIEKHKARLKAELTKARLKRGFASIEDLRAHVDEGHLDIKVARNGQDTQRADGAHPVSKEWLHPRWVRINSIKTGLSEQMSITFTSYETVSCLEKILEVVPNSNEKLIYVDKHVPNLVAVSPFIDLTKTSAYQNGYIILQDKASCFPAYLLDPIPEDGDIVDACAAPGNKTTHLAAILQKKGGDAQNRKIYACDRDKARAMTLKNMVSTAGASRIVTIKAGQDFLRLDHDQAPWNDVGSILLDPSCSGSGMTARDGVFRVMLPSRIRAEQCQTHSKKRKRKPTSTSKPEPQEIQEELPISDDKPSNQLSDRLKALSNFQLKLLTHALQYPKARRIVYSTCSIHAEENEHVVVKALDSAIAKTRGWRILRREEQVAGLNAWAIRGDFQACTDVTAAEGMEAIAEACIRCEKGSKEGTQGFFVAAFVRDGESGVDEQRLEEEWGGFSDNEVIT